MASQCFWKSDGRLSKITNKDSTKEEDNKKIGKLKSKMESTRQGPIKSSIAKSWQAKKLFMIDTWFINGRLTLVENS